MAREAGLEPATDGLENHCSIQLSYSRTNGTLLRVVHRMNFGSWMSNKDFDLQIGSQRNYG